MESATEWLAALAPGFYRPELEGHGAFSFLRHTLLAQEIPSADTAHLSNWLIDAAAFGAILLVFLKIIDHFKRKPSLEQELEKLLRQIRAELSQQRLEQASHLSEVRGRVEGAHQRVDLLTHDLNNKLQRLPGINGQPALLYNGTSDYLLSSFLLNSAYNHAFTLVAVLQPNNTNLQGFAVSVDLQFQAALYNWNNGFVAFDIGGNLIGSYGASIANYVGPMVIVMSYDGTTARTFVNGVESFETPITANLGATTALEVGAIGGGSQFSGMIRDIVVYNHGGSVNEDSAVSKWFMEHRGFSRQQIVWNGDSLTMGEAATANGGLPYVSAALIGPSALAWSACNTGWYGQTLVTEINDAGNRMYPGVMPGFNPLAVVWFGTNDLALGAASATTIFADYRYYCLQLQALGYKVIAVTMLPRQDAAQTAGFETARKSFNSSVVTSWATFADGLADLGDDPTIGVYGASSNTTYYNADKIHLLNAGYLIAAPTVANAIKHALRQPVYLSGTLAAGTCTINDADLVPGIAPSAPVHLWSSGANAGTLSISSFTLPTGGAPGQIVVHSTNSADTDTFKVQLN
jgi:hypothetical protein